MSRHDIQMGEVWPHGLSWGYLSREYVPAKGAMADWAIRVIRGERGIESKPSSTIIQNPYISLKFIPPFVRYQERQSVMCQARCLHYPVIHIGWVKGWRFICQFFWSEVTHATYSEDFEITAEAMKQGLSELYGNKD